MNEPALAAFVSRKAEIDAIIERLRSASADHFGVTPDEIDWGHVGNLGYCLERLADAAEFIQRGRVPINRPANCLVPERSHCPEGCCEPSEGR